MNYSIKFICLFLCAVSTTLAVPVTLQNSTATFSQLNFGIDEAIDGDLSLGSGWAIAGDPSDETAVWETTSDLNAQTITFTMTQLFGSKHIIGKFRWSVTQDDRSTFADGLITGGDVIANWTFLENAVASSVNGLTFTNQVDHSILVSGAIPETDTYTVTYNLPFANITGFRLEVLEDPSLPINGPGFQPTNGNIVLNDLTLDASGSFSTVSEASNFLLFSLSFLCLIVKKQKT